MQDRKASRAIWSAGMAAVLLSAFVLVQPASHQAAFAASDDHMMDKGDHMMTDGDGHMMSAKSATLKGNIASIQQDSDGRPAWIQSGIWILHRLHDGSISFTARINMVAADGTSPHMHVISRFVANGTSDKGGIYAISGTATVSIKRSSVEKVPLTIRVFNGAAIAIQIDEKAPGGHFGGSPIYGTVNQPRGAMMEGAMMENKLTKTSLPVTLPLTRGYVGGNEVFYISTEASDKELAMHLTQLTGSRVAYSPALGRTPDGALANIYAFTNGIKGPGPLGFQPNVADSQPGDARYSPVWRINTVEWQGGATPRELKSEQQILDAQSAAEVKVTATKMVVNCPFVQWHGGSLQVRQDKTLADGSPYGGGQVLSIDTEKMQATFVAHRGFAPDGSTIYYIATDASVKEVADALGVLYVAKTGAALETSAAADLWVFANGIKGTGPMGFQASIAGSNVGDDSYSPLWRILATKWSDPGQAKFLTTSEQIASAGGAGMLSVDIAGVVVNCPFVEV